jgi:hypothetical protein
MMRIQVAIKVNIVAAIVSPPDFRSKVVPPRRLLDEPE